MLTQNIYEGCVMNRMHSIFLLLFLTLCSTRSTAQTIVDKNKGDHNETKKGMMDGNLAATVYYNFGEVADWLNDPSRSGVWPKGTNHTYVDGVAVIVQAETRDPEGRTIHPLETNYYEYTRHDNATGVTYGWWPLPNYAARFQSSPAQSTDQRTWPDHWPDRTHDWDGSWNGFFGKGVQNADLETFFVMDDNEDREYLLRNGFHPDAADITRGGLGMQVRARGFQWSQVLAEDVIFWYYEITNMGTADYEKTLFAQYVDWGIGGHDNSSNNAGSYNKLQNISYAWSTVPVGSPGNWSPVGYAGYAFLESPGISDDHRDNDQDGLTDERRDNAAGTFITSAFQDPYLIDVASDTAKFRRFYGFAWKPHWEGDENTNWRTFFDLNANGTWDQDEPLNDDVGSDGIGPFDQGYTGPDLDRTEGNGKPDQGEPNFGILDKDESDQLGLTGFLISVVHTYDLNNDEKNWTALSALPPPPDQLPSLIGVNLANHFSSYLFHLYGRDTYSARTGRLQETGETERFSMSMIYGLDLNDLLRRKRTVQQIYNANYRFAKPPEKAIAKFIPGDGKVSMYWDSRAEQTFDPFYQKFNFEGYRVYRSTEPNFLENKIITDAYGKPTFRQPIAQFDLIDGVRGLHPINVNGALFDLGNDTGLQHSFIDSTVQNGQTYYYAVVAYDQGFSTTNIVGEFQGIPPTETTSILKIDVNGRIKTDINTGVVTPRAGAAGYVSADTMNGSRSGPGTGSMSTTLLDPTLLKNHSYKMEFVDSTAFHTNARPYYRLLDVTSRDTLIPLTRMKSQQEVTSIIHGFAININNDTTVSIDLQKTGWKRGNSNYVVQVGFDSRYAPAYQGRRVNYPADFEITLTEKGQGDISFPQDGFSNPVPSNVLIHNVTENADHIQFIFRDNNTDSTFNAGDAVFIVYGDSAGKQAEPVPSSRKSWSVTFLKDTLIPESQQRLPQPGDVFRIVTKKPFRTGEFFSFAVRPPAFDQKKAQDDMVNVAVVPNPYVGAASWEPATTSVGRGERRVYFIHLPAKCTIRIYTISGRLVQTIEHSSTVDDGQEPWNLVSRDGMDIAYGVYIFHVEAPGIGQRIDKFAIMK